MTAPALRALAEALERAAAELDQSADPYHRMWAGHFREDRKAVLLIARRMDPEAPR